MRSGRIAAVLFALLTVIACGAKNDKHQSQGMEQEGKAKIGSVNKTSQELGAMGIDVTVNGGQAVDWSRFTPQQRQEIGRKLTSNVINANRVMEIGRHKNMRLHGDVGQLQAIKTNSQAYLNSLRDYDMQQKRGGPRVDQRPPGTQQKTKEQKVAEANQLLEKINSAGQDLMANYQMSFEANAAAYDFTRLTPEQTQQVRAQLVDMDSNLRGLLELTNDPQVEITGGSSAVQQMTSLRSTVQARLAALEQDRTRRSQQVTVQ